MIPTHQITGLILAGGRAQRMGGIDKGLIAFRNKPLIEFAIARLIDQVGCIQITANRNLEQYSAYGYPIVMDETPDFSGPLAGFAAGLRECKTEYLVTVPCDTPLFPVDLVNRMGGQLIDGNHELIYASSKDAMGKIWAQPVFCLMQKGVAKSLENFLKSGERKIDHWFGKLRSTTIVFEDEKAFSNVNTPDELSSLEKNSE